jgi:hypothetical protein
MAFVPEGAKPAAIRQQRELLWQNQSEGQADSQKLIHKSQ